MSRRHGAGFTLVEIMIVVSIISLLSVIAVPSFMRARQTAQNAKFMNGLRVAAGAYEEYAMEHGAYPVDVNRSTVPPGLATYFDSTFDWTKPTPIGGSWDWDFNVFGFVAGISVVGSTASISQITQIDSKMDDGDLTTGQFLAPSSDRYTYILQ
jgi:prepilin-type N-terminal cleavage/methylation domain-containing protein